MMRNLSCSQVKQTAVSERWNRFGSLRIPKIWVIVRSSDPGHCAFHQSLQYHMEVRMKLVRREIGLTLDRCRTVYVVRDLRFKLTLLSHQRNIREMLDYFPLQPSVWLTTSLILNLLVAAARGLPWGVPSDRSPDPSDRSYWWASQCLWPGWAVLSRADRRFTVRYHYTTGHVVTHR